MMSRDVACPTPETIDSVNLKNKEGESVRILTSRKPKHSN